MSVKSMTGYARRTGSCLLGHFVIELLSVNKKGLDLSLSLPKELLCFDPDLRKKLSSCIHRGQVSLRLTFTDSISDLHPSKIDSLKKKKQDWEGVCHTLGVSPSEITLSFLLKELPQTVFFSPDEQEEIRSSILTTLQDALDGLLYMKKQEGTFLLQDLLSRLATLEALLEKVDQRHQEFLPQYEVKIQEKIESRALLSDIEKGIAIKEIVALLEKFAIDEEQVRLQSHLAQFRSYLMDPLSKGRTLDFLIQEMGREIGTMGAKIGSHAGSLLIVEMRSELEKIREQVQNIE